MAGPGYGVADVFGANLARYRLKAGLSQEELAFRASIHRNGIGLLERGVRLARIDTVVKVSGALGVSPGDLFEGLAWEVGKYAAGRFRIAPSPGGDGGSGEAAL